MHIFINIRQAQMGGGKGAQANLGGQGPPGPPWSRQWIYNVY